MIKVIFTLIAMSLSSHALGIDFDSLTPSVRSQGNKIEFINTRYIGNSRESVIKELFSSENGIYSRGIKNIEQMLRGRRVSLGYSQRKNFEKMGITKRVRRALGRRFSPSEALKEAKSIINNSFSSATDSQFESYYMNSSSKEYLSFSDLLLYSSSALNPKGSYGSYIVLQGDNGLDINRYNIGKGLSTRKDHFVVRPFIADLTKVKGIDYHNKHGDLSVSLRRVSYNGEVYILLLSPEQRGIQSISLKNIGLAKNIKSENGVGGYNYSNVKPGVIGVIRSCSSLSNCTFPKYLMSKFLKVSSQEVPSELLESIAKLQKGGVAMKLFLHDDNIRREGNNLSMLSDLTGELRAKGDKIDRIFYKPTTKYDFSTAYKFKEIELHPGHDLYFYIPEGVSQTPLTSITVIHRQRGRILGVGERDSSPGLTSVQVYSNDFSPSRGWRYWGGYSSGRDGAKFAEPRRSGEHDNLFEWQKFGHKQVGTKNRSYKLIRPNVIRVRSLGLDPVLISGLSINTVAPRAEIYKNYIFSRGTVLGDPVTLVGRKYGGGQKFQGTFPTALKVSKSGVRGNKLPAGWSFSGGLLRIPLEVGKKLSSFDIACGDSHPDRVQNKDGGWGSLGNSRLNVGILRTSQINIHWVLTNKNVGPENVIFGNPKYRNINSKAGDQLVIKVAGDPSYLMGLRLGYNQSEQE